MHGVVMMWKSSGGEHGVCMVRAGSYSFIRGDDEGVANVVIFVYRCDGRVQVPGTCRTKLSEEYFNHIIKKTLPSLCLHEGNTPPGHDTLLGRLTGVPRVIFLFQAGNTEADVAPSTSVMAIPRWPVWEAARGVPRWSNNLSGAPDTLMGRQGGHEQRMADSPSLDALSPSRPN